MPIALPVHDDQSTWAWADKKEVRIKLLLGNEQSDEAALAAIKRKYGPEITAHASSWDVSPLVVDSMNAFIVKNIDSPIEGTAPYRRINVNAKSVVLKFSCTSQETAQVISRGLINGDYDVQIAFHFSSRIELGMNISSATAENLSDALNHTIIDGGNANIQFIHQSQIGDFIRMYTNNLAALIFKEKFTNTSELLTNLQKEFETRTVAGKRFNQFKLV